MSAFKDAIDKLISMENFPSIDSPLKSVCSRMGCNTPLEKLLQTFSPSAVKYLEKEKENAADVNGYKFVENMSPTSLSLSLNQYHSVVHNSGTTVHSIANQCQDKDSPRAKFYPGSMLAGSSENMSCPSAIESYLNMNSNGSDKNGEQFENYSHQNYHDEVMGNYHQNAWSQINSVMTENMLPPVMLSNYEDIALLQQDLQATNGLQHYVLPIFFQPVMVPEKDKAKKPDKRKNPPRKKTKSNTDHTFTKEVYDDVGYANVECTDQKVPGRVVSMPLHTDWFSEVHPSDEELLNRCKLALEPETSNIRPPRSATNNISMKYLEEAALKLLQGGNTTEVKTEEDDNNFSPGKFKCKVCHRVFRRQYTLSTHTRIHTGEKPFKCDICGQGFRQSGTKLNHIRAVHAKEKPFKCQFCGKTFSHKSSITVHIRIHTNEKPYKCETCGRRFTDRATYSKHQPTHSGDKPYRCPVCAKCFSQKSNLKRHFKNIHEHIHDKELNCLDIQSNRHLESIFDE